VVAALSEIIRERRWGWEEAVAALGWMGPSADTAAPVLSGLLAEDEDWKVHDAATAALVRIGKGQSVLPRVTEWLREQSLASMAIDLLGEMGPAAREAVPALIELGWKSLRERSHVVGVLGKIAPDEIPGDWK
jgi:HEAT repeat protein